MPYDGPHFRYFMVNKYHDVIHDYGPGSSDERWEKVQNQLTKFDPARFTLGGVRVKNNIPHGTMRRRNPLSTFMKSKSTNQLIGRTSDSPVKSRIVNTRKGRTINRSIMFSKQDALFDDDISDLLSDFVESVNTKIGFNTFYAHIYNSPKISTIFNFEDGKSSSSLKKLYTRIAYYSRSRYLSMNHSQSAYQIIKEFMDLTPHTDNLFHILDKIILVSIYDTAYEKQAGSIRRMYSPMVLQNGGAKAVDEKLNKDELVELIKELKVERERLVSQIKQIYDAFSNTPNDYATLRMFALNAVKSVLKKDEYKQMSKSGSVDNASSCINKCCFFPPIPRSSRQANKTLDEYTKECFLDYFDTGLIGYYNGILNGFIVEEEAARLRVEREQIRADSGQLTKDQRLIREQFCSLIAKLGLVLNGEYTVDGKQNEIENVQKFDDAMTAKEVNLLANWSNWNWNPKYHTTVIRPSGARSNIDVDLFNATDAHFSEYIIDDFPICRSSPNMKYVIDNAAMVPNNLKDYVFCPVSSVVDGMKKCNASQLDEYGNMDFVMCDREQYISYINNTAPNTVPSRPLRDDAITPSIANTITHYYNGRSIYNRATGSTEYVIEILTPFFNNPVKLSRNISLAGTALEAHNVLRETLVHVINFIVYLQESYPVISTCIYKNPNGIFGGLYDCLFNTKYDTYPGLDDKLHEIRYMFLTVILSILFKGAGDLFQEINAVCKWGGYSGDYECGDEVIPYNSDSTKSSNNGNTLRMLIANDQPSGCRFAFLLLNGYPEFTNQYAFGGYMGAGKMLLVTRADISGQFKELICSPSTKYKESPNVLHNPNASFNGGKHNRKQSRRRKNKNKGTKSRN